MTHSCGNGIHTFKGAGAGYYILCGTRLCGHGIIPNPAQSRGKNPEECPEKIPRHCVGTPFRLRDHIPRESTTPGFHGTSCMGSSHTRDSLGRNPTGCFVWDLLIATTGSTGVFVRDPAIAILPGTGSGHDATKAAGKIPRNDVKIFLASSGLNILYQISSTTVVQ